MHAVCNSPDVRRDLARQVSRRVSTLNQAWAWACAIRQVTEPCWFIHCPTFRRTLSWLHHEMTWACEDLEEAGAWPIDIDINIEFDSGTVLQDLIPLLEALAAVSAFEGDGVGAIIEVKARATACLRALRTGDDDFAPALAAA